MTHPSGSILAIISHSPLSGHNLYEALSALMVLATYGQRVQLLFVGDAVQSLQQPPALLDTDRGTDSTVRFKSVQAMIESFEFYDLLPVWVGNLPIPPQPLVDCVSISMAQLDMQQFKAILTW